MLLADVFERFINTCIKNYGLDPCHDLSSPGLSRYVMLKMAEIELELIADNDMHLFIEEKWEEVFLTLLKDTVKQILKTWNLIMLMNQICYVFWMQIIYMIGQWVDFFPIVDLNRKIKKDLISLMWTQLV